MKKVFLIFIFSSFLFSQEKFSLNIYWTDKPPVIDGKMTEKCWKEAEVITDFRIFQKPEERATQQIEVRICYDAKNIYIFYKNYEDEMAKLSYGPPEDMRDMLNFSGDVIEFFIDPKKTKKHYYQFCVSPSGARYDYSSKKGSSFNPDWKVAIGIYDKYWTCEAEIPFNQLVHKEEYYSTPQIGEIWGIQFCRDEARLHEWSQWVPTPMSFHQVELFGNAIFKGKKDLLNYPPRIIKKDEETLNFGKRTFSFEAESKINLLYKIKNDGKIIEEKRKLVEGKIDIPYHITDGGIWEIEIEGYLDKSLIYTGKTFVELPYIGKLIKNIDDKIRNAEIKLINFKNPVVSQLNEKIKILKDDLYNCSSTFKNSYKLSNEEWKILLDNIQKLKKYWNEFEFDIFLISLYPVDKETSFTYGIVGPYEKIYPDKIPEKMEKEVKISLAGGEYESFQVIIIPFWTDLKNVNVKFQELKGENGKIGSENFSWYIVDYVYLQNLDPDSGIREIQPDILIPGKKFDLPHGQLKSIFIDFYCPEGTKYGEYKGEIIVETENGKLGIPVIVNAFGFDIPKKSSLENNFWFDPAGFSWGRFYGIIPYGKNPYTLDIYKKQAEKISKYRITPFCDSVPALAPHLKIYYEEDSKFSFDFSEWEKFIDTGLEYGGNSFRASLSCNLGAFLIFSWADIIDRKTGEKINVKKITEEWEKKFNKGEVYYDEHPLWPQYLKSLVEFLKKKGILEISTFEIYDEPNSNPRYLDMIRHHKFLRQIVPELKLINFGVNPLREQAEKKPIGLHDIWAPHLTDISPEILNEMQKRREIYGEKYWFYTCGERVDSEGNFSPYIYYHRPYIGARILSWFAWKLKADGMLIFALNGIPEENIKKDISEKWPNSKWVDGNWRGCGTLIYPGPEYEVIPSMRIVSVRDGLEDYEYFKKLHKLSAYLDKDKNEEIIKKVEKCLKIEKEIIEDYYHWTKDIKLIEKKRKEIAELIREIEKIIKEL